MVYNKYVCSIIHSISNTRNTIKKTFEKLSLIFAPHRDCIKVVDPLPFFQSCVFDMCRYQGLQQVLCDQLQAYTDACLSAGAPVHQWREPDFCRESFSHLLYHTASGVGFEKRFENIIIKQ